MQITFNDRPHVLLLYESDAVWDSATYEQVQKHAQQIEFGLVKAGYEVTPIQIASPSELEAAFAPFDPSASIVFNWFETGILGHCKDAALIASSLQNLGYLYTGADGLALKMAFDKPSIKDALLAWGIPTPDYLVAHDENLEKWNKFPAIIKVADDHGSEGMTSDWVVRDELSLRTRIAQIKNRRLNPLMVSEFIDGTEITVSMWGNDWMAFLPLLQVDYSALPQDVPHIRTFQSKDVQESSGIRLIEASQMPIELENRIRQIAISTYRICGLRDYGRIDFRLRDNLPMVIDVNPNPDITEEGSFIIAARLAGYDYPAMLDQIIRFTISRGESDKHLMVDYANGREFA